MQMDQTETMASSSEKPSSEECSYYNWAAFVCLLAVAENFALDGSPAAPSVQPLVAVAVAAALEIEMRLVACEGKLVIMGPVWAAGLRHNDAVQIQLAVKQHCVGEMAVDSVLVYMKIFERKVWVLLLCVLLLVLALRKMDGCQCWVAPMISTHFPSN